VAREKAVERVAVDAQDATDANRLEPPVVDEATDGLRMDAEAARNLADAVEALIRVDGPHGPDQPSHAEAASAMRRVGHRRRERRAPPAPANASPEPVTRCRSKRRGGGGDGGFDAAVGRVLFAVVESQRPEHHPEEGGHHACANDEVDQAGLAHAITPFPGL
jgi:hypothetical protein